jgi:hypothetical protein
MPKHVFSSMSLLLLGTALALALSGNIEAQTYQLSSLSSVPGQNGQLQVNVIETSKGINTFPDVQRLSDPKLWHVTVYNKSKASANLVPAPPVTVTAVNPAADYLRSGQVTLITDAGYSLDPYPSTPIIVKVDFVGGESLATAMLPTTISPPAPPSAGCNAGPVAQQPGTSYVNYCFSGIWIPQVGSHPLYTTSSDVSGALKLGMGSIGIRAQESAASSTVLDPNAFSAAIFYQSVLANSSPIPHVMGVYFNWNLATVEFDRKKKNTNLGTNVDLITAPEFVIPLSLGQLGGLDLDEGIEAGHNYKNNIDPNGFGTVFRDLLGAQYVKIFAPERPVKALSKIKITSQYQTRILFENEVITRAVHGKLIPYEGHQARNWVSTEFDYMFTKNVGVTLKHDYGALPPGYVVIENRATVGFTVQSSR